MQSRVHVDGRSGRSPNHEFTRLQFNWETNGGSNEGFCFLDCDEEAWKVALSLSPRIAAFFRQFFEATVDIPDPFGCQN